MLQDWKVVRAVAEIADHAEDEPDIAVLEETYVDCGALPRIANGNSQIIYGRRGTGKSHLLKVASALLGRQSTDATLYIDLRRLGSAQLMTDPAQPLTVRCVTVFRDLLAQIQDKLLDLTTDPDRPSQGAGLEEVSALAEIIAARAAKLSDRQVTLERSSTQATGWSVTGQVGSSGATLAAGLTAESGGTGRMVEEYREVLSDTIVFAEVAAGLDKAVEAIGIRRLIVLLDEWPAIPPDVQPYVAEFLKRVLLPSPRFALKIASLEQRSRFATMVQEFRIGFEIGSDISANVDLDDYFVFERAPEHVGNVFRELLLRHIRSRLESNYLEQTYSVDTPQRLEAGIFDSTNTFVTLIRAGEGVARDLLGIFNSAFFSCVRDRSSSITHTAIEHSARRWFKTDKATNLTLDLEHKLRRLARDVVKPNGSRRFMLGRDDSLHTSVQALFDMRLIHLAERGWMSSRFDERLDVYTLDFGACQELASFQPSTNGSEDDETSPLLRLSDLWSGL
jgi:hypothetical protein